MGYSLQVNKMDLSKKRVTITGGKGFLGTHLVRKLKVERCCKNVFLADLHEYDLRLLENIKKMFDDQKPNIIIHLAAVVGGIGVNRENPGKFFYDNLMIGVQLMEQGRLFRLQKFVAIGTVCAYPKFTTVPFKGRSLTGIPIDKSATSLLATASVSSISNPSSPMLRTPSSLLSR